MNPNKEHKLLHNMRMVAAHMEQVVLKTNLMQETKNNMGVLRIKSSDSVGRIVATHILVREEQLVHDITYQDLNGEMVYEYVLKGDL